MTTENKCQWFELQSLGVICVEGQDRLTFLNGQLTQDMNRLQGKQAMFCAYCNPKGRVIALFHAFDADGVLYLVTEKALLPSVIHRLNKFILRADVRLNDVSQDYSVLGIQQSPLSPAFPPSHEGLSVENGVFLMRMPPYAERGLMICPVEKRSERLSSVGVPMNAKGEEAVWDILNIKNGYPKVVSDCSEQFVAQSLNLDCLNAISFTKGCYVGQEIVARMHYLGKSRQRMRLVQAKEDSAIKKGDKLLDQSGEKIGEVVTAQKYLGQGMIAQIVCGDEWVDKETVLESGQRWVVLNYGYLED